MKRTWIAAGLFLAGLGLGMAWQGIVQGDGRVTTSRLSPDETTRALLVEARSFRSPERIATLRLERLADHRETTLYQSPEEGGPPGTERLLWSRDGTKLLLVGRHFFVKDDLFLDNGDQLYFLHDLTTGKSWCNAAEQTKLPPLRAEQVRGIEFTEPVVLK